MLLVAVAAAAVPISSPLISQSSWSTYRVRGERGKGRGGADCSRAGPFLKARTGVDVCVCLCVRALLALRQHLACGSDVASLRVGLDLPSDISCRVFCERYGRRERPGALHNALVRSLCILWLGCSHLWLTLVILDSCFSLRLVAPSPAGFDSPDLNYDDYFSMPLDALYGSLWP